MKVITAMVCGLVLLTSPTSPTSPVRAQTITASATRYVDVAGSRIGYRSIGSGIPLVLLNRFRGTLDTWDPLFLAELAREHRVITLDYPGVGYSAGTLPTDIGQVASFVSTFTTTIGLQRFAVLGWSWGGIVAQTLLLQSAETVSHAVLVGTAPPGPGQAEIQPAWLQRALKPINDLSDEEILFFEPASESSRKAAKLSHDRIYARPDVAARIPATETEFQRFFGLATAFKTDAPGRRTQLTTSPVPMLILCGDNDPSVPATNWYPLIGRIPRAQIVVLPQSGHGPQHQYPRLSAKYIAAFLQERSH